MRKISRVAAVAVALAGFAAGAGSRAGGELEVRRVEFSAVTDLGDDRRLVGIAHDVFFGEVIEKRGQTEGEESMPETQFAVRVLETIKGSLAGVVTVNQQGGVADGELVLMEGDALLQPGVRYLFATRRYVSKGWHTLVPRFGDIKVESTQHREALRARFTSAKANEIPFVFG